MNSISFKHLGKMLQMLFGYNNGSTSENESCLDPILKQRLCKVYFAIPLGRSILTIVAGLVLFVHMISHPLPTKMDVTDSNLPVGYKWRTILGRVSAQDSDLFAIFIHLTVILPMSIINMRMGLHLYKLRKSMISMKQLKIHFGFIIFWLLYATIGMLLVRIFSPGFPAMLITLVPELIMDLLGLIFSGLLLRKLYKLKQAASGYSLDLASNIGSVMFDWTPPDETQFHNAARN